MPPVEIKAELIAEKVKDLLASIDASEEGGAKYWYTPDAVVRVDDFEVRFLRREKPVVYLIRPGDTFPGQKTTRQLDKQEELFVLAAKLWTPNTTDPYGMTPPIRWTLQNRLRSDVEKKLESESPGILLGGLGYNLEVREWSYDVFVEEGHLWALIMGRIVVTHRHERGKP